MQRGEDELGPSDECQGQITTDAKQLMYQSNESIKYYKMFNIIVNYVLTTDKIRDPIILVR